MLDSKQGTPIVVDTSGSPHAPLRSLPLDAVRLSDDFWEPRRRVNRDVTLPSQFAHIEQTGRLDNFRRAAGKIDVPFRGVYFNDSDVYKWLEAASWSLATDPDPELERMADVAITEVADAQRPDGYLNTYFTFQRADERWTDLTHKHELYCAGHLIQAAVAHFSATGSESLLEVAVRFADHICSIFGPEEEGKQPAVDGHEEIEMAMVELARRTGESKYLEQAHFFVDARGYGLLGGRAYHAEHGLAGGREYHQDHKPFREMDEVVGHAVRALYLNAGAADVYAETGDAELLAALERLWRNLTTKRMYVTGGLGSRYEDEAFGTDYELPNERAYTETCAAIASVMWNWRMLLISGDARYADLMEHTLYNACLPGVSLDGEHYFYQNPLADDGTHCRRPWFGVACCPPNVARLLASLPGYFYSASADAAWVHLYAEGTATVRLDGNREVRLTQRTLYPWDGNITIEVDGEEDFGLMLRIPSWCEQGAEIEVNGEPFTAPVVPGSYAEIRRTWRPGDAVGLRLTMPVRRIESHPQVLENAGRVALMRGPILYCAEQVDNPSMDLREVLLPLDEQKEDLVDPCPELLGGINVLRLPVQIAQTDEAWDGILYRTVMIGEGGSRVSTAEATAVPYYAWANREAGTMRVWFKSQQMVRK